jgi:prophage regulatory protein
LKQVVAMTGLPPASIYALINAGDFPRQVSLSVNRVGWVEAEVQAWLRARVDDTKHRRVTSK